MFLGSCQDRGMGAVGGGGGCGLRMVRKSTGKGEVWGEKEMMSLAFLSVW